MDHYNSMGVPEVKREGKGQQDRRNNRRKLPKFEGRQTSTNSRSSTNSKQVKPKGTHDHTETHKLLKAKSRENLNSSKRKVTCHIKAMLSKIISGFPSRNVGSQEEDIFISAKRKQTKPIILNLSTLSFKHEIVFQLSKAERVYYHYTCPTSNDEVLQVEMKGFRQ